MNPLTRFLNKFPILFRRGRFGSELEEEMAFHCAQAEQEFVASGMTPEAARYAAIRQFGNQTKLMEQSHQEVTFRVEPLVQDLQFALRQWRRNPGFALTAVLILALGMGVSVAIFSCTVSSGSGYMHVGWGKSVSNRMRSAPTDSIRSGSRPWFRSNQNVAKRFERKYSDGGFFSSASSSGEFSAIS